MQLKKCKFWLKWGEKHVFLLKKAVFCDINLFHTANNVAKPGCFLEIKACSSLFHLLFQLFDDRFEGIPVSLMVGEDDEGVFLAGALGLFTGADMEHHLVNKRVNREKENTEHREQHGEEHASRARIDVKNHMISHKILQNGCLRSRVHSQTNIL